MLPKWKYPSAKNITQADVEAYVESLGGYERSEEEQKELDAIDKKHSLGKYAKKGACDDK
jgi:hypothetical protein